MDTPLSSDLLLARRAAAGQADAWNELVELYGQRLFNLALHFTGAIEEAEDLTQEIFLRLHRNLRQYPGDRPFASWALRLSRNLCIDHYRRTRREHRSVRVSEEVLAQIPAKADPVAEAETREQMQAVYRSLEEMSEDMAEVVLLRDLQGWTMEEVAAALDVPLGTIKSRLHRARLDLAERVQMRLRPRIVPNGPRLEAAPC